MTEIKITAASKGKTVLVGDGETIREVKLDDVSPSGAFVKVGDEWKDVAKVGILEVLDGRQPVSKPADKRTNDEKRKAVDEFVRKFPESSVREIAEAVGVSSHLVYRRLAAKGLRMSTSGAEPGNEKNVSDDARGDQAVALP